MSIIKVENLTFAYPGSYDAVFENVSFQLDTDWKLGFVGRNGRGKTTFLNLLSGRYEYGGRIVSSVPFDYFPYPVADESRPTDAVLRDVCPDAADWAVQRELSCLQVAPDVLPQPFNTLSNGERTKVLLAALFLNPDRFLLIDEPTNHLDLYGRAVVSAYLKRKKHFILVSHDRAFLDGCVDHILALNRTNIEVQSGNFTSWMTDFSRRQDCEAAQNERLRADIDRMQQAARRTANWSERAEERKLATKNSGLKPDRGYVGHKAAKLMKRAKALEDRQQQAIAEKAKLLQNAEKSEQLKLTPLLHRAERLVELTDVAVCYDGRTVCRDVRLSVSRGERVALTGKNGCGKSSLLKLIVGQDIPHTGTVQTASGLIVSYVPQDTAHLSGSLSGYAARQGIDESLFKTILRKMDFSRVQFEKDMADFSSGQKKKTLIAASLCKPAHLYVWDEPLNFIDVYSRMQIETLLTSFSPAMVFVEHDRAFIEAIATGTLAL